MLIKDGKVKIRNIKTKEVVCEAYRRNDLYAMKVEIDKNVPRDISKEANTLKIENDDLWHRRFCHVNNNTIKKLADGNRVIGLDNVKMDKYTCESCYVGKATKTVCRKLKSRRKKYVN